MDEQFLYTFGLVKKNTLKMMMDRNFIVQKDLIDLEPCEIAFEMYKKAKSLGISLAEAATETFVNEYANTKQVIFADRNYDFAKRRDKMISTDQIKEIMNLEISCIVVLPFKMSPQAKKESQKVTNIELFTFEELIIDIPRHFMYMKHTLVSEQDFMRKTGKQQRPQDLPKMLRTDAVAKWFGFQSGSILEIERPEGKIFRYIE